MATASSLHALSATCARALRSASLVELPPLLLTEDHRVFWKGKEVHLPRTNSTRLVRDPYVNWKLLLALVDRANEMVSASELIADVFPEKSGEITIQNRMRIYFLVSAIEERFKSVDRDFHALRFWRDSKFAWDTGERENGVRFKEHAIVYQNLREVFWKGHRLDLGYREFDLVLEFLKLPEPDFITRDEVFRISRVRRLPQTLSVEAKRRRALAVLRRIRGAFRAVDPGFDCIKKVGLGRYSWRPN